MDYEVFQWEGRREVGRPCERPSFNEMRLLQLCCWAMGGTLAQKRIAGMLLDDLDEARFIARDDVLEHDHAADFFTAFQRSFKDGPVSADAYVGSRLV